MSNSILYMGDDGLDGAASYLAGVLAHFGLPFDHVPGTEPAAGVPLAGRRCVILSDYPASSWTGDGMAELASRVEAGCGLLMIGGWESFSGQNREYTDTSLADVLPGVMQRGDDRVNSAQPVLIRKVADHPTVNGLPWNTPPGIGGYNRFSPKPGTETILEAQHVTVAESGGRYDFTLARTAPLLVVGRHGNGRTAALATDAAPHWVGGFVDWGEPRLDAAAPGAAPIQVGAWYARFFEALVRWTAGEE